MFYYITPLVAADGGKRRVAVKHPQAAVCVCVDVELSCPRAAVLTAVMDHRVSFPPARSGAMSTTERA